MSEKIGEFLVQIGVMKPYQREEVLRTQKAGDKRLFGEIAIEFGYINDEILQKYVEAKLARERTNHQSDILTKQFIVQNAEYSIESSSHHWTARIWENIVLLAVSGTWPAKHYPHYFGDFWDIFCERRKIWEKVYFVVNANNMPIQNEEFRGYVQTNWSHLLDRPDFCLCIVECKSMKRAIWKSIYRLINVQSKIQLFRDHSQALQWVQRNRSVHSSNRSK
jgi:hypothetical protein